MDTIFEQSPYFIFLILFLPTTHSIFSVAVIARLGVVLETPYEYFKQQLLFDLPKD